MKIIDVGLTLQNVTDEGGTTTNDISVAGFTATGDINLDIDSGANSLTLLDTGANLILEGKGQLDNNTLWIGFGDLDNFSGGAKIYISGSASKVKVDQQLQLNNYTSATSYTGDQVGLLGFDATGSIVTVATASGDPVGGTGTQYYLPLWADSDTLGDSLVYQNSSATSLTLKAPLITVGDFTTTNATRILVRDAQDDVVVLSSILQHNISPTSGYFLVTDGSGETVVDLFKVSGSGQITAGKYGEGLWTSGDAVYTLAVSQSGELIEIPVGAGTVDGTGTANYITRWEDSNTITTSSLYEDPTNNQIGIGTTSPGEALEVVGNVEATEFIGDLRGAVLFKAQAGEALSKGDVVYISGIAGNLTVVSKADCDDSAKMPAFGVAAQAASLNTPVNIYTFGLLTQIDTSTPGWSLGDALYVSSSAGELTNVQPSGESSQVQKIAKVTRVHATEGSITISGAGRSNATPNLNTGHLFVGDSSNYAISDDTVYVDIANSKVGVNTTSPISPLHVATADVTVSTGLYTSDIVSITANSTAPGFNIISAGNSEFNRGVYKATRARGTVTSPSVVQNNDYVFSLLGAAYDGTTNYATAGIEMRVDGTATTNTVPQRIEFQTGTGTSRTTKMQIKSSGLIIMDDYGGGTFTGTAAKYLAVQSNGNVIEVDVPTANLDGSGTANYISKWSDSDTLTNSVMYDDGTDIGIGTTSISARLHVVGNGNGENIFYAYSSTSGSNFTLLDNGNISFNTNGDTTLISNRYPDGGNSNKGNIFIGGGGQNVVEDNNLAQYASYNTSLGDRALFDLTSGENNTAIGNNALFNNESGSSNTAIGTDALLSNTSADNNTAVGERSLLNNTTGYSNTAVGKSSLQQNTTGYLNTAVGLNSSLFNSTGVGNSSLGTSAALFTSTGEYNVAIGYNSLYNNTVGSKNIAIGALSGGVGTHNTSSIYIGYDVDASAATGVDNEIAIGTLTVGNGSNTFTYGNSSMTKHIFTAGQLQAKSYTSATSYTGDEVGLLGFDATGSIVTVATSSGDPVGQDGNGTTNYVTKWLDSDTITTSSIYDDGTNVGIGTTSPSENLHIKDTTINGVTLLVESDAEGGFGVNTATLQIKSTGSALVDPAEFSINALSDTITIQSTSPIQFQNASYYSFTTGYVGINTNSPSERLDVQGNIQISGSNLSYQPKSGISTSSNIVATYPTADCDCVFFDYVIKTTTGSNLRAGTVMAVHDGTNVEYTETSTNDIGNTSAFTFIVNISGGNIRLLGSASSGTYDVKTLVRTI